MVGGILEQGKGFQREARIGHASGVRDGQGVRKGDMLDRAPVVRLEGLNELLSIASGEVLGAGDDSSGARIGIEERRGGVQRP